MSTLTKILAVLLSVAVIFFSGVTVVFVGNTNLWKTAHDDMKAQYDGVSGKYEQAVSQMNALTAESQQAKDGYKKDVALRDKTNADLAQELKTTKLALVEAQTRVGGWAGTAEGFQKTIDNLRNEIKLTSEQLTASQKDLLVTKRQLGEANANLSEKIAENLRSEAERKRLAEKLLAVESQAVKGTETAVVTKVQQAAEPVTAASDVAIRGLISEVSEELVALSVGTADGVKEGMTFHVTRGDIFICDVVVTHVDINQSAGVLKLVQDKPRTGDSVSTW